MVITWTRPKSRGLSHTGRTIQVRYPWINQATPTFSQKHSSNKNSSPLSLDHYPFCSKKKDIHDNTRGLNADHKQMDPRGRPYVKGNHPCMRWARTKPLCEEEKLNERAAFSFLIFFLTKPKETRYKKKKDHPSTLRHLLHGHNLSLLCSLFHTNNIPSLFLSYYLRLPLNPTPYHKHVLNRSCKGSSELPVLTPPFRCLSLLLSVSRWLSFYLLLLSLLFLSSLGSLAQAAKSY